MLFNGPSDGGRGRGEIIAKTFNRSRRASNEPCVALWRDKPNMNRAKVSDCAAKGALIRKQTVDYETQTKHVNSTTKSYARTS